MRIGQEAKKNIQRQKHSQQNVYSKSRPKTVAGSLIVLWIADIRPNDGKVKVQTQESGKKNMSGRLTSSTSLFPLEALGIFGPISSSYRGSWRTAKQVDFCPVEEEVTSKLIPPKPHKTLSIWSMQTRSHSLSTVTLSNTQYV